VSHVIYKLKYLIQSDYFKELFLGITKCCNYAIILIPTIMGITILIAVIPQVNGVMTSSDDSLLLKINYYLVHVIFTIDYYCCVIIILVVIGKITTIIILIVLLFL